MNRDKVEARMKPQRLIAADDDLADIRLGLMRQTVRLGRREIEPGSLRFQTSDAFEADYLFVTVKEVDVVRVGDLSADSPEMATARRFYPAASLTPDKELTIIRFTWPAASRASSAGGA